MLGKIKSKLKKNANNRSESFRLKPISDNIFPYSCLVADDVLLTKNGELMQTVEILLDDFKLNQEGGLRDKIQQAILHNTNDFKTSFWIQTVKRKGKSNSTDTSSIKHPFLKKLFEISKKNEESLNNYSTYVYITVIRQGINFKISPSTIKNYLSATFLRMKHNNYIDQALNDLRSITNRIVSMLTIYNPKVLGTERRFDGKEYSKLIEILYFLVNFEDKQQRIVPVDISNLVNDSHYLFENGVMVMQNQTSQKLKMASSFSLKEIPNIRVSAVSDIINNTRAEMIVSEYVSYVDQKSAAASFKEQMSFLNSREDKTFQHTVGLDFIDSSANSKYCKSSLSITIFGSNFDELQQFMGECLTMFAKHGIVMAREDVSLERNYYAMMPANFSFTHRLSIHAAKDVGCFCYSYTPPEVDTSNFLGEKMLFNFGTLKGNPVAFGLDKITPNLIIGGLENSGKTTIANYIAGSMLREFDDMNMYIIEYRNRSKTFIDAVGGDWYQISLDKQKHTALFNPLNLQNFDKDKEKNEYLFEFFSLLLSANNVLVTPEISNEIQKLCDYTVNFSKSTKSFAIHDIRQGMSGLSIDNELQAWHSIGRYYHLFDNRDDVFDRNNLMAFFIDETITSNSMVFASLVNYMFTNIINRAIKTQKPTLIVVDEPFLTFGNNFFKSKINKMIDLMMKNNVYVIYHATSIESESSTVVDFSHMMQTCGTQIHFSNKFADNNYGRVFGLDKTEYLSIKTLATMEGRYFLLKQGKDIFTCKFDLSHEPKTLGLLSDNGETQAKVLSIKEQLQTDAIERWLPAYYGDFKSSDDAKAKMLVQKELETLSNVRRLLES